MLKAANPNPSYYYKNALSARERALQSKYPEDRIFYFEAEARWLKLAESYEFLERAKQFIATRHNLQERPSCPACVLAMPLVEVQVIPGAADYRYQCSQCGYNICITVCDD